MQATFTPPTGYDEAQLPVYMSGNVFLNGALPSKHEQAPLVADGRDAGFVLVERADGLYLEGSVDPAWTAGPQRQLVTTELLGTAEIPGLPYENPDGTPLRIDADYFGAPRSAENPVPGPFAVPGGGAQALKVWAVGASE